ncbi:nidogen-like domain-containing protein [Sulfurimonas sp.]|uniref:nidogen-like domain-containing protein n=1 Tax=Sulfurimonas sp. TaxID=2022749 RepID=UPI002615945F|nr:nidogen-like domain-containing protein [Sulfurimonas sp.]MDD3855534.1 DUF4214 domain-containing protein [Sulfurimonas sp.]
MATLINGLGGEKGFGENSVYRNDDGYSDAIDITSIFSSGINLFQNTYTSMYVNTNGNITFNSGLYTYTPGSIGADTTYPIFAPFWADVDTRSGEVSAATNVVVDVAYDLNTYRAWLANDTEYFEQIDILSTLSNYDISSYDLNYYNAFITSAQNLGVDSTTLSSYDLNHYYNFLYEKNLQIDELTPDSSYNTNGNSMGSNLVWYDLDAATNTITVTWDDVGYYNYDQDKTNAFQLQLIKTGDSTFDIKFIYEDVNWTTGSASGGVNGFGGNVARAGYSAGDGLHYFELPFSGDQSGMLGLEDFVAPSQTAAGVWQLSIEDGYVTGMGLENTGDSLLGGTTDDFLDGRSGDDVINGGFGNDTIVGGLGNDTLHGEDGNDVFYSGGGTDYIYGGAGTDVLRYTNGFNDYDFTQGDLFNVLSLDGSSVDYLDGVESLGFGDLDTITPEDAVELRTLEESVARLYSALLGRNGDNTGFLYWLNDVASGNELPTVAGAFGESEEYLARFGAQSNEEFINQLYNNILERNADQSGYDYWLNEIQATGNRNNMIVSFSNSGEYITEQEVAINNYLSNVDLSTYIA